MNKTELKTKTKKKHSINQIGAGSEIPKETDICRKCKKFQARILDIIVEARQEGIYVSKIGVEHKVYDKKQGRNAHSGSVKVGFATDNCAASDTFTRNIDA